MMLRTGLAISRTKPDFVRQLLNRGQLNDILQTHNSGAPKRSDAGTSLNDSDADA
jgi:hypothetical protein